MTRYLNHIIVALGLMLLLGSCKSAQSGPTHDEVKSDKDGFNVIITSTFHDAVNLRLAGKIDAAIEKFNDVLRLDPHNAASMYELSRIYLDKDNLALATELAKNAYKENSDNPYYTSLYAECLAYSGNYKDASRLYDKIITRNPTELELYFDLAYMYEQAGDLKNAIATYDRVEKQIGVQEEVIMRKQKLYIKMQDLNGAVRELNKLIDSDPQNVRFYMFLAELYQLNGMQEKASDVFDQMLEVDPDNPMAQLAMAGKYRREGKRDLYMDYAERAMGNPLLDIDVKVSYLVDLMSGISHDQQLQEESIRLLDIFTDTHPNSAKAHALYGDFLYQMEKSAEALDQYDLALALEKNVYSVWQQVLFIHSDLDQIDSMLSRSEQVIELFPNQPIGYFFNGLANSRLKNYEVAVDALEESLLIGTDNNALKAEIYSTLGDTYHAMGEHKKSDDNYDRSLKINPNNPFVLNNYSYYLSLRKENLEKAAQMARKANEIMPDQTSFEDTYGWVLFQQGDYTGALKWLEKAMEHGGEKSAEILEHYGDTLFKLDKKDQAVLFWQQALMLEPGRDGLADKIQQQKL